MSRHEYPDPPPPKAGTYVVEPIGYVASVITASDTAPLQPDEGAPPATLVLDQRLEPAIDGLGIGDEIVVLT